MELPFQYIMRLYEFHLYRKLYLPCYLC